MSAIFADTCCDLDAKQVKKLNINLVDLDKKDVFEAFKKAFQPYLDEEEDIIYLSTNLDNVKDYFEKAVNYFSGLYERRVIKAIDLNQTSVGAGLVVYEAGLMYKRGCTDLEITQFVEKFKKEVYGLLISQNKDYLSNCNNLEKINMSGSFNLISPIVFIKSTNADIIDKAQGKKRAITSMCNYIKANCVNVADYPLIVGYFDDEVNAEYLKASIIKNLGEDAVVLLQKFNQTNKDLMGKNALFVAFYSKKLR